MLDIAIIGAGPAGFSAAINAVIRNKEVKVIGKDPKTSLLYKAEEVNNYLGMPKLTGEEMVNSFAKHAKELGVDVIEGNVVEVYDMGSHYTLNVDNEFIDAKTIILATGIAKAKYFDGESEFVGRGVSYCATCDGMLYRDKTVAVVAEDKNEYFEEVKYLSEIVEKLYLIPKFEINEELPKNVEVLYDKPVAVEGMEYVKVLKMKNHKVEIDGLFILRETMPIGQLIKGIELDENVIKVNRNMETNIRGVYAAGDCTGKPFQVAKAVGEGLIAGLSVVSYLSKVEKESKVTSLV
ncbi:MAG: FAD-dependent oxidoreductase [Clostridia bacterium]|jgi:thioredoxin reductase (NADPH)|nr:FAD-dependent oxidoreductase [Clostridia bacterium]